MKKLLFTSLMVVLSGIALQAQNVGIGTATPDARLVVNGAWASTPTDVSAGAAPIVPVNVSHIRLTNDALISANVIVPPATAAEGQLLNIVNNDTESATFAGTTITPLTGAASFIYLSGVWYRLGVSNVISGGPGGTLDDAYDFGGPGLGRVIYADAGVVAVNGVDGFVTTGTLGAGASIGIVNGIPSGAGTRMFFNPTKAAFRAGNVSGTQWDAANVGVSSSAMGESTTASGAASTALGTSNNAIGASSTTMGTSNDAIGANSTAMGTLTISSGAASTAMGTSTFAGGASSTAMGTSSISGGVSSTAMGTSNNAIGASSTAMGTSNQAVGVSSTAMGTLTVAEGATSTAMGTSTLASGATSTAMGTSTTAAGASSTSMGTSTIATGASSTAMGNANNAIGVASTVMGTLNVAVGDAATAMGTSTTAGGASSTAMGTSTNATGASSTAMGTGNDAIGASSTAMGTGNDAIGASSTAMGTQTIAGGDNSTAMGTTTFAGGAGSTAMGASTTAGGATSTAMGSGTTASGVTSTAMGTNTIASGPTSTALGVGTVANGVASLTAGEGTTAPSYGETTIGINSLAYAPTSAALYVPSDRLFSVGNGTTPGTPSNALTILKNGNVGIGSTAPGVLLDVNGTTRLGTNGTQLTEVIKATVNADLPIIAAGTSYVHTFLVANSALTSTVGVSPTNALDDGLIIAYGRVSMIGTVEVKFTNVSGLAIDPLVQDFLITVVR